MVFWNNANRPKHTNLWVKKFQHVIRFIEMSQLAGMDFEIAKWKWKFSWCFLLCAKLFAKLSTAFISVTTCINQFSWGFLTKCGIKKYLRFYNFKVETRNIICTTSSSFCLIACDINFHNTINIQWAYIFRFIPNNIHKPDSG